jgi:hypothetical protein
MHAEFMHAGKLHRFEVQDVGQGWPAALEITSRACVKSPMIRFHLAYSHLDVNRNVAIYAVMTVTAAGEVQG